MMRKADEVRLPPRSRYPLSLTDAARSRAYARREVKTVNPWLLNLNQFRREAAFACSVMATHGRRRSHIVGT
jgi:hypothetical protein